MLILGIETSCDETGAAVIEGRSGTNRVKLLSNVVASSLPLHAKSGGIIPENAAREQIKFIIPVINEAIQQCNNLAIGDIDAIAVTFGPGLIGSLLIGVETAKTLSYIWGIPLVPTNHLLGHIYANFIDLSSWSGSDHDRILSNKDSIAPALPASRSLQNDILFPAIALIVSGGHTDLVFMKQHGDITWLGGTRDDAAGECFDKCARLLGYEYPGGPKISQLAQKGNLNKFAFPRPMTGSHNSEFSFSGLKTAFFNATGQHFPILRTSHEKIGWQQVVLEEHIQQSQKQTLYDLCASLEKAIVDVLIKKTLDASEKFSAKSILLGGGVAANSSLRENFKFQISNFKLSTQLFAPPKSLCTDNAAMIATAAFFNNKHISWQKLDANPGLYF